MRKWENNGWHFGDPASEKGLYSSSCCLLSGELFSHPYAGFVKSQEGENEDGSEGELVVKFVDALPKVNWNPHGREAFRFAKQYDIPELPAWKGPQKTLKSNPRSFSYGNIFRNIAVMFSLKRVCKNAEWT